MPALPINSRRLAEKLEHLREPFDLSLGFLQVLVEGGLKVLGLGAADHLLEAGDDLALGVIDVLDTVEEKVFHCLGGHRSLLLSCERLPKWRKRLRGDSTSRSDLCSPHMRESRPSANQAEPMPCRAPRRRQRGRFRRAIRSRPHRACRQSRPPAGAGGRRRRGR